MTTPDLVDREASRPASLLIADDYALGRTAVRAVAARLLPQAPVVEVGDGVSLLRAAGASSRHQLAVVSASMLGLSTQVLHDLADLCPALPIVVVSSSRSTSASSPLLRVRTVTAVLDKEADSLQLRNAIEAAIQGPAGEHVCGIACSEPPPSVLTGRQRDVYRLMCEGLSNKLIARTLNISAGTVKNHVSDIFKIMKASNRTHAVRLGYPI